MGDTRTHRYRIIVSGRLGVVCREAFGDLRIEPHGTDTALTGDLSQSGLHDVLTRIRDLAVELVGFTCLAPDPCGPRFRQAVRQSATASGAVSGDDIGPRHIEGA